MKLNHRLFIRCLAIAVGAVLVFLWSRNRTNEPLPQPVAKPVAALPSTTTPRAPATAAPAVSLFEEKQFVASAPPPTLAEVQAAVRVKLKQWFATNTGDTEIQEALIKELLDLLTDENTAEVIKGLSPQEWNTPFSTAALDLWLKQDPAQAARWVATRTDAREEQALLVARHLLESPVELHAYCDLLPETAWKQHVLRHASLEMVAKDPIAAVAFAQRLAPGDVQTDSLETIAYDWFGRDLAAAVNWTKSVEDPALRERLLAVGAKAIAIADPDLAAGWLVSAVKTEGVLGETALSIVETWADQHPAQAATWVARFSDAGPRKAAVDLLLNHWLKSDPASANAWIQTLPEREAILAKLKAEQAERERAPDVD